MKGDFTRDTFDWTNHFSRVLMQQGRVQLDADWNEQTSILLHYIQTLASDLIGPYGGPVDDYGFEISKPTGDDNLRAGDFIIGKGRYYVDGILCEVDARTSFAAQPLWPNAAASLVSAGKYLIYLDVWEQHVTAIEQQVAPGLGRMREVALGGPDTCSRARVVWQVKWTNCNPGGDEIGDLKCDEIRTDWADWTTTWQAPNRGYLRAGLADTAPSKNPCITDPESRYRGQENQLYRVEVHRGGVIRPATRGVDIDKAKANKAEDAQPYATFKWSRDNGSVLARVIEKQGASLTLDCARGFASKAWAELTTRKDALNGVPGVLRQIKTVDGDAITLDTGADEEQPLPEKIDFVRRWDQQERGDVVLDHDDNAVPIVEGTPIALENGIEITFEPSTQGDANRYRTGDYWLIPARVVTNSLEWPIEKKPGASNEWQPKALPPNGVMHHYAPLAIVTMGNDKSIAVTSDCRCQILNSDTCSPRENRQRPAAA